MIEFAIPGTAPSTPNLREHWAAKAKRTRAQRAAVARKMPKWTDGPLLIVRLTRVGPRSLDSDNLAAALKGHRDAVAARLRVDDATPLVRWEYHQEKGGAAVVVQVWRAGESEPYGTNDSLRQPSTVEAQRKPTANHRLPDEGKHRTKACGCLRSLGRCEHSGLYDPPRSTPVDAAKEAEVFAPPTPRCHADSDGDCGWAHCPQEANGRANYKSWCPLAAKREDD